MKTYIPGNRIAHEPVQRDDSDMRTSQSGTSVLASLVFVALFVLIISSYRLITPPEFPNQSAAVLSAFNEGTQIVSVPERCIAGELHTVNVENNQSSLSLLRCYIQDPTDSERRIPGPDILKPGCAYADVDRCVVRYCPPSTMVTEHGMCIRLQSCDPAGGDSCARAAIQAAMRPEQSANILASALINDRGSTQAQTGDRDVSVPLASLLTTAGGQQVSAVIESTAQAAEATDSQRETLLRIVEDINDSGNVRYAKPTAHISCQPKTVDPGMKVSIAFGCAHAQQSASRGFSTAGRLWGATEEYISTSSRNGTLAYSLTCTNGRFVDVARCEVSLVKPFILLAADAAADGLTGSVSWLTRGVTACTMMTDNPAYESGLPLAPAESGFARFALSDRDTRIAMECVTAAGNITRAEVVLPKKD